MKLSVSLKSETSEDDPEEIPVEQEKSGADFAKRLQNVLCFSEYVL